MQLCENCLWICDNTNDLWNVKCEMWMEKKKEKKKRNKKIDLERKNNKFK